MTRSGDRTQWERQTQPGTAECADGRCANAAVRGAVNFFLFQFRYGCGQNVTHQQVKYSHPMMSLSTDTACERSVDIAGPSGGELSTLPWVEHGTP